jgi:hypothetical protein
MKRIIALALAVGTAAVALALAAFASATPRSGILHLTKECSQYTGAAGSFCTVASSNLNAIKVGSRIVYAKADGDPTPGVLDSDLVIDGPGNNTAFGHVVLADAPGSSGPVTISGGTGVFTYFHADLVVTCELPPSVTCSWDGPYSFSPQ